VDGLRGRPLPRVRRVDAGEEWDVLEV
jgi:hypothetical protein